jgi:hypothetical protein
LPYALLILGAALFVAGIRGKNADLWDLVKGDFTGTDSFVVWIVAVGIVGGVGYVKPLKPFSIAFLTLLLVVLFLSNRGVIAKLQTYLNSSGTTATPATAGLAPLAPLAPMQAIQDHLGSTL